MVQLIALLYKDQHVTTLHKLLNLWLDSSISESSEDNESNTSPQNRGSKNSSPNLTSNPTSDSSDAGGSGKSNDEANFLNNDWDASSRNNMNSSQPFQFPRSADNHVYNNNSGDSGDCCDGGDASDGVDNLKDTIKSDTPVSASDSNENYSENYQQRKSEKKVVISGNSDYGYVTQIENQESISTSSNEDELPTKKPFHQKPHTTKQRINNKVVTAIREFVQAIELYKKSPHTCDDDQDKLVSLQMKMCETDELRSLLVLLLRNFNPKYHPKQYLQDLIVTNHILLMFLDSIMKMPDYKGSTSMAEHIKQFATPEMMSQYGLLLEDYEGNGEFVNDCIFTMMHHVGGELGCYISLFQPKILKTFTSICQAEFEICDDWSDLIEYVINTFIKKPQSLQCIGTNQLESEKWTEDEISSLNWNYIQCNTTSDVIGEVLKLLKEDGIIKKRNSVIKELFKQSIINKEEFEKLLKYEMDRPPKAVEVNKEMRDDEIGKLCEQLAQDGKSKFLNWVQTVLLDTCYAKIYFEKKAQMDIDFTNKDKDMDNTKDPIASSVSYHSLVLKQSVPLVPWNCEQASICKDLKFLQLLHKLGFHMPVDSGKVFIRIPHFWTPDFIFDVASKISPIEKCE
ncbi:Protein timeless [Papilio machaon]|uniref:Protein timeless n=1 Tax=Papilio machaon TaxID=76193 RepID=A0A194RBF1_PAPMA|nr:Protein timeless [Papilio machaon]